MDLDFPPDGSGLGDHALRAGRRATRTHGDHRQPARRRTRAQLESRAAGAHPSADSAARRRALAGFPLPQFFGPVPRRRRSLAELDSSWLAVREARAGAVKRGTVMNDRRRTFSPPLALLRGRRVAPRRARACRRVARRDAGPQLPTTLTRLLRRSSGDDSTVDVTLPFSFTVEGAELHDAFPLRRTAGSSSAATPRATATRRNDCLPTSAHTNPLLAAYWDDLNPFGTNVRYGTVGTQPEPRLHRRLRGRHQLGRRLRTTCASRCRSTRRSNLISGALPRQQSQRERAGPRRSASRARRRGRDDAQPLTCNGKILDDNRPDEGWSVDVGRAGARHASPP